MVLMGTQKPFSLSMLKPHISHVNRGFLRELVYRLMIRTGNFLWVLGCSYLLFLFGFLDRYLHRLEADEDFGTSDSSFISDQSRGLDDILELNSDGSEKENRFEHFLVFKFQNKETGETEDPVVLENLPVPRVSKYEINHQKEYSGFVEEPKTVSLTVKELFLESNDDSYAENGNGWHQNSRVTLESGFGENPRGGDELLEDSSDLSNENSETEDKTEDSVLAHSQETDCQNLDKVNIGENDSQGNAKMEKLLSGFGEFSEKIQSTPWNWEAGERAEDSVPVHSQETALKRAEKVISSDNNFHVEKGIEDFDLGCFSGEFSLPLSHTELDTIANQEEQSPEGFNLRKDFDAEEDDDFIELDPNLQSSENKWAATGSFSGKSVELSSEKNAYGAEEEEDEFDILLQHQEKVEKMRTEMKNSRNRLGLPTILENGEVSKLGEDLKPLEIDEKFEYKDIMEEIQKIYKSYSEKMRKLDILNYQTLNAISFMQLKEPNQKALGQKSSYSAMISLLLPSLWPSKLRRIHADPTSKSIFEMHKDLETVYVGQMCLSWEILQWEYEKARELLKHQDYEGVRSYNLAAGEFQQFQVLVERFLENEKFQGPRVLNYVKERCELRCLLQVPAIKEDCPKEKMDDNVGGEYAISISMLFDIIEDTIRVFEEFLCVDKDDKFPNLKGLLQKDVDLRNHLDSELLKEIKADLQLKERRLKDILRAGNCIVKKFRRPQRGRTDWDLILAQIELKLVSRVLKMSRLTDDQLIWCLRRLDKVNFSSRKVHVEPSFLLFPF